MMDKAHALATCSRCSWQATIAGDDMTDIVSSLRKILIQHVTECHPDHIGKQATIVYRDVDLTEGLKR